MRMLLSIGTVALLAGCAKPKPASEPAPGGQAPASAAGGESGGAPDFEALASREATGLTEHAVTGPGKKFTAKVRASEPPKVTNDGDVAIVVIPIGSGAPIQCQVFSKVLDAGGTVNGVLGEAAGKVEFARVAPWAIEVVKEVPTTFVHALYTAQSPKGKLLGELKIAAHAPSERSIICLHDELGFEKTFLDGVKTFAESIQYTDKFDAPTFVDVQIAKVKDSPVGFSKTMISADGAKHRFVETTTLLLPATQSSLRVQDDYSVETVDQDLRVETGVWVSATGGQLDLKLEAKRTKPGAYHYAGEVQGKKVEGDFKTKDGKGLPSSMSIAKELATRGKGSNPFSFEAFSYHPGLDPTAPMSSRYFREKGEPELSVHQQIGKATVTGVLDELGLMKKGEVPLGPISLTLERSFVRGKF